MTPAERATDPTAHAPMEYGAASHKIARPNGDSRCCALRGDPRTPRRVLSMDRAHSSAPDRTISRRRIACRGRSARRLGAGGATWCLRCPSPPGIGEARHVSIKLGPILTSHGSAPAIVRTGSTNSGLDSTTFELSTKASAVSTSLRARSAIRVDGSQI